LRVKGWYVPEAGSVRCIIIADESGLVVGAAAYGGERLDVVRAAPAEGRPLNSGFQGVLEVSDVEATYRAYAVLEGDDELRLIPGTLRAADAE
jgi:hypothetical protein